MSRFLDAKVIIFPQSARENLINVPMPAPPNAAHLGGGMKKATTFNRSDKLSAADWGKPSAFEDVLLVEVQITGTLVINGQPGETLFVLQIQSFLVLLR